MFCDGGSDDDTCVLLQKYALNYCHSPRGRTLQMNTGASACDSDILIFIHADTVISSSDIELAKKAMQDEAIVGGRFDVCLSGENFAFRIIEYMINLRSRITGISTGDQCQFVRRSVFEAMGGFPEQRLMEDVEFSKRLKRYGKIACLKNKVVTSSRRWEKHGIIKTVMLMWKLRLLYWLGTSPEKLAEIYHHAR
jgi:rSAM/selenodomain-associated transferase 2